MGLRTFLFPDPPRRIPAHRGLGITFRTAHLIAFGILLGGHVFGIDEARLRGFLIAAIASGAALMALELASTFAWLAQGKGLAVLAKLAILVAVPFFWAQRVPLLVLAIVVASIGAHMPARFRHRQFGGLLGGRR